MAESPLGNRRHTWACSLGRILLDGIRRAYALGVIVLVLWLSFAALRYLVGTLLWPAAAPARIVGIPTRLTESVLETGQSRWPGVQASEMPRVPLAHYHRLGSWVRPDRFNDCTRSGCHAPLPHSQRKEVRAFLNMHATSIHCGVCHLQSESQPLPTTWYDLDVGEPRDAPSILQTYAWLVSEEGRRELATPTPRMQRRLVELLRTAAEEADGARELRQLAEHVAAVRHTSPAFQELLDTARDALPRHFRGEYGAKLALRESPRRPTARPILAHANTQAAVETYFREQATADPARREQLVAAVHPQRRPAALHCTDCHAAEGGLIDFAAAGYPPARVQMLSQPVIFRMIEHIAAGQPFYLPGFMQPPSTQPAPPAAPQ